MTDKELQETIRKLGEQHLKAFRETIEDPETWKAKGPQTFKIMRIIWPRYGMVEGIGSVVVFEDMKYGRQWAKRWEG